MNCILNNPIQAVLFDLDGTLIDTAPDFIATLNRLRKDYQLPALPSEQIRAQVSNGARALVTLSFGNETDNPQFSKQLTELLDLYENSLAEHSRVFSGLDDTLALLEQHAIPWGIVTNKPTRFTTPLLEQLNLHKRCSIAICPDHVSQRKPHPEPILKACSELGVTPEYALYVGDHLRDIESGNRAGCFTVAASWGYIDAADSAASWRANLICDTPAEFGQWLADQINLR